MIVPIITLVLGASGGYFFARARGLDKEREAQLQQQQLSAQLAAAKALPPAPQEGGAVGGGAAIPPPSVLPTDAYREPDRTAVIKLPVDAEDFDQLGNAICTCYAALKDDAPDGVVDAASLRDCLLAAIYPDFRWPPVPGDPAAARMMWLIADHEARKALAGADLQQCALDPSVPKVPGGPGRFRAR